MKENKLPAHLDQIGGLIGDGWKKIAEKHSIKISLLPPNALVTFSFDYDNALELKTLFTQEMLKRGYLAGPSVYVSYAHNEKIVKDYLETVDEVFGIIKQTINNNNINELLEGPVAHAGFQRLT